MAKKNKGIGRIGLIVALVSLVLLGIASCAPIADPEWTRDLLASLEVRFLLVLLTIIVIGIVGLTVHHAYQKITVAQFIAQISRHFLFLGFAAMVTPGGLSYLSSSIGADSGKIEINFVAATWVSVAGLFVLAATMLTFTWILVFLQSQRMEDITL